MSTYRKKVQLYTCEVCNLENENKSFFDVHHIDEDHSNNIEYNLVTVCTNCHRQIHLKQIANIKWAMSTKGRILLFDRNINSVT